MRQASVFPRAGEEVVEGEGKQVVRKHAWKMCEMYKLMTRLAIHI